MGERYYIYKDPDTFRVQFANLSAVKIQQTIEKAALEGIIKVVEKFFNRQLGPIWAVFGGRATFPFRSYANVYMFILMGKRSIAFKGFRDPEKVLVY